MNLALDEFYDHPDAEDHIAAWEIEQDRCPHHGGPRSECPDEERDWFPQRQICTVEKQLKAAQRTYDEIHKDRPFHDGMERIWSDKWSELTPFRYDDGVTIWMSPVEINPDDDFLSL